MTDSPNSPNISVVIPVYNAESFLRDTIESVLCQTFRDFELLLLDDGSTDHSVDIIRSYTDPRICFIPCEHDFIGTVNQGYGRARGKYIAQLDHDDLMVPQRLQIQYRFMEEHPHIAACGGWMHCFGMRTNVIRMPLQHEQIVLDMLLHGPILNPTGFVRKQFITAHQIKHQSDYSYYADFKFWSEIAKKGQLANIPKVLTLYRTSDKQTSEKYATECQSIANKVKFEMMQYLLACIKEDPPAWNSIQHILPVLMQLNTQNIISKPVFFRFIHELIGGVKNKYYLCAVK